MSSAPDDAGECTAYTARWVMPIASPPIERGVVVVNAREIVFVGAEIPQEFGHAHLVALGNSVLMPGLVNAHSHLELTAMRGMLEGRPFRAWLRTLTAARQALFDRESRLDAARQGIAEALRNGITTLADTTDSGVSLDAMREAGVRGIGYIEVFGPDVAQCDASMEVLTERAATQRALDTALVRTGVSPHAPYSVSVRLFERVARLAMDKAYPVAVHIAESKSETAFVCEGAGPFADGLRARGIAVAASARSPVSLLSDTGVLSTRPLLIHAVHVSPEDINLIRDAGATVAHCPISNAKLGHGTAPLQQYLDAGVAVGLGTDSVASTDRMDILGEARQAALFAALQAGQPDALSAESALEMATLGGARALGIADRVGTLEKGKDADLAVFPLTDPDIGNVYDPAVTLVHVLAGRVQATMVTVAGRQLVRDGVLLARHPGLDARAAEFGSRLKTWMRAH
ncbi:MAG: amidohydrolase family protein [Gemmatimonas sp.]